MIGREDHKALVSRGILAFTVAVLLFAGQGCHWGRQETASPAEKTRGPAQAPGGPAEPAAASSPARGTAAPGPEPSVSPERPEGVGTPSGVPEGGKEPADGAATQERPTEAPEATTGAAPAEFPEAAKPAEMPPSAETANNHRPLAAVPSTGAGRSVQPQAPGVEPAWANGREELVYRIDFLGITMGYARFTYKGKAILRGRRTYHLNVRAWTSGLLSVVYPVNETIDYYLDEKTLAPLRQEFSNRERKKDDVAIYDQETGRIVYRYKHTGEIRKKVDATPNVYDPVSAAYYFRARDLGSEDRPRNVYAGRKLWQISARNLGVERLNTSRGPVETVIIQPVIKREGKLEDKGDLRMWMTNDARHVPVRIYAKFKKIRIWTLVGELMPQQEGG